MSIIKKNFIYEEKSGNCYKSKFTKILYKYNNKYNKYNSIISLALEPTGFFQNTGFKAVKKILK